VRRKGEVDAGFWDRADAHIDLANKHCDGVPAGKVSASLLFGAARFNAFVVASQMRSAADLKARKVEALEYFTGEFRKMLKDNLDDYIENFGKYTARSASGDA
jgi:hypothetical protein